MLKPLVSKFRPDLSSRSKDITEKQVPAKLKPIVDLKRIVSALELGRPESDNFCW